MSLMVNPTRFFGLGGMQEIGKSTLVIEDDYDIVIIDAGIKFANLFHTGIRGMVPNYQYLQEKQAKIRGLFITHGHEDHIGGIIFLVQEVDIKKIFAPKIAIQYLKAKFEDQKIRPKIEFIEINKNDTHRFESFTVDFWTAQHSIPDAFGIRITSRHGSIMCTGDFRFDYTPIGNYTDFERLKEIGNQKLTVLFSDSTNAMRPNHSPSERDILGDIEMHMRSATRKIIITAFASNLTRIKALIEIGIKLEKKILVFGRSMVNGINIGRRSGYINVDDNVFLGKNLEGVEENQMLILTTGSQGEQLAALDRMSNRKHPKISIEPRDLIIFSSSPIPGNKIKIEHLINRLYKLSAIIKENGPDGYLHTSGHAYKAEHEKIFQLTKPKYFFPYHGEYRMCLAHSRTAIESGVDPKNVIIPENGQVFKMYNQEIYKTNEKIPCDPVYIDGETISRDNSRIINERQEMRENGFVFVLVPFDRQKNSINGRISVITKGAFSTKNGTQIIAEIRRLCFASIKFFIEKQPKWSPPQIKQLIKNRLNSYFHRTKRWKPVILTQILYVDQKEDFLKNYQEKTTEKFVVKKIKTNLTKESEKNKEIPTKKGKKMENHPKTEQNYNKLAKKSDLNKKVQNLQIRQKNVNVKSSKTEKDQENKIKKSIEKVTRKINSTLRKTKNDNQSDILIEKSPNSNQKNPNKFKNKNPQKTENLVFFKKENLKKSYENDAKKIKKSLINSKNLPYNNNNNNNKENVKNSGDPQALLARKKLYPLKNKKQNTLFQTKKQELNVPKSPKKFKKSNFITAINTKINKENNKKNSQKSNKIPKNA